MSSVTDKPISHQSEDLLKVENYSRALSNFIVRSETPITIGLQGEWGTGKTSLMSLLQEDFNEKEIACSWVNTWEYSMFKSANETTPGVLRGMLEKLKAECVRRGVWTIKQDSQDKFKKAARFIGGLANQIVANQTGVDLKKAADESGAEGSHGAAEIAQIKELINTVISDLVQDSKNPIQKIVFFVDDLDRIPPGDAVEVLEALKNIFDIPHCVFVLAIDYDVVVKGLESKFGVKTEDNEREFRSFFDKIIQVPFSMPVGTYDIENFLVEKLTGLNIHVSEENKEVYTQIVKHTIGYNPRSLKRYLNSFSLINHLKELDPDHEDTEEDVLMLFAILGIQISYPRIFRMLAQKADFTTWDKAFANKVGIEWDSVEDRLKKYGENTLVDEEWEQVCWSFCQSDSYLKSRAFSLLELLNLLRDRYKNDLDAQIAHAMTFAAITSVDDDVATKQEVQKIGNKTIYNGIDTKLSQLKEEGFSEDAVQGYAALWSVLSEKTESDSKFRISFAKTGSGFYDDSLGGRGKNQLIYCSNPSKANQGMKVWVKSNSGKVNHVFSELKERFSIHEDSLVYISERDLVLESGLIQAIGLSRYKEAMGLVAQLVIS